MEDIIRDYLQFRMPGAENIAISNFEKMVGGSSRETLCFNAEWTEGGRRTESSLVIRRDPVASILECDRDVEFRLMQSLESTPIPSPKMHWVEQDEKWLERPFMIMERLPGICHPGRVGLLAPEDPALRAKIADQFVQILSHIHTTDWKALGLSFLGCPDTGTDCASRAIEKWEKVIDEQKLEPRLVLTEGLLWLKNNKPETERITLVHGDFKQDNFLYEGEELTAMLDWEMAHLGDPMEDLGWACMWCWRGGDPLVCGLMDKEEFFQRYQELSGIEVDRQKVFFYQVLGCIKFSAIMLTAGRAFYEGKSLNAAHAVMGTFQLGMENEMARLLGF